eukprot:scaffold1974_cov75-Cylindrotheca_fusiformis.AAC.2
MRPRAESNETESSTITARPPMPPPPPPLSPLPSPLVIDTHNTTTTTQVASRPDHQERQEEEDNREVLKREVERRSMSLTGPERTFLDHLAIHGNAVEVQLAVETLENDDLFFDWETPRHLKETSLPPDVPTPEGRPFLERNLSLGSQRRLKILEERKHAKSALWQAHESGIAITQAASRKSLVKRSSSLTSVLSGSSPPFPPPPSPLNQPQVSSSSSTTVVGQSPPADDIFRRSTTTTPRRNRSGMMAASPMRRARHQRSQSMIVSPTPPRVPTPVRFATSRRRSSSNKSVSFHPETTPNDRTKTRKGLRRSVSDSLSLMAKGTTTTKSPTSGTGGVAGRPPLPQPQQHQRMDSMSSIPSIHHGHPIRSESISSIPSLHPASAIRSGDSVCSIPSLHSAHPIHDRSGDSSTTTTSSTVPPILQQQQQQQQQQQHQEEEQANKIRNLLDDDDTVPQSLEESHKTLLPSSPTRKVLVHKNSILDENKQTLIPKYSATPDIASAWLKQQQQQQQSGNKYQSKALEFESSSSFLEKEPTDETESTRSTIVVNDDEDDNDDNHHHLVQKSVLVRRASRNIYDGEGMEVTELDENAKPVLEEQASPAQIWWESNASIRACNSFDDETMSYYSHRQNNFDEIFRSSIRRTLSDEEVAAANILVGSSGALVQETRFLV